MRRNFIRIQNLVGQCGGDDRWTKIWGFVAAKCANFRENENEKKKLHHWPFFGRQWIAWTPSLQRKHSQKKIEMIKPHQKGEKAGVGLYVDETADGLVVKSVSFHFL